MATTPTNADIEREYHRVLRLVRAYGLDAPWELVPGRERRGEERRTSWQITEAGLILFDLGFTRRSAEDTLSTIGGVFEWLLSNDIQDD